MSTPAVLPGSMAAARCSTSSAAETQPAEPRLLGIPSSLISERLHRIDGTVRVLGEDQDVDNADRSESTSASNSFAISPVKLLAPAGNSTTM